MSAKGRYRKPEWAPENAGDEFASHVLPGASPDYLANKEVQKKAGSSLSTDDYVEGIISGNRTILARAITLIESNSAKHKEKAQELLQRLLDRTGNSIRIGITGAPGAGKSTFIEAFGSYLCENEHKVAVLAIDPSSSRTKGSILGDKTRMEELSRLENAFIRPSLSSGTLGGVAGKTRETILLCEAAGFDTIIVETIGVGQSEITVRSMVDFLMLLLLPGGGDELQGIKKGSVELADAIVINKADGENINIVNQTKSSYEQAVHYIQPATTGWHTKVLTASALNHIGMEQAWELIKQFEDLTKGTGIFQERRKEQTLQWVFSMVEDAIKNRFYSSSEVSSLLPEIEKNVIQGTLTPSNAVKILLNTYFK